MSVTVNNCMVAVGGSYKHLISPVADLDGCLVSYQDLYILLSKSEKCGLEIISLS